MDIALILNFSGGEIVLEEYSRIDISRHGNEVHINVSNDNPDMAFNDKYNIILDLLGNDETFSVTVKKEKGQATFENMAADYYLTNDGEMLHFGTKPEQQQEQQEESKEKDARME